MRQIRTSRDVRLVVKDIAAQPTSQLDKLSSLTKEVAEKAAAQVKKNILSGRVVPANSPEYAAWKRRNALGTVPLVSSGEYVDSIGAFKEEDGRYFVGVEDTKHSSGVGMRKLSAILEFGTLDGIPARPHFTPVEHRARRELLIKMRAERKRIVEASKKRKQP